MTGVYPKDEMGPDRGGILVHGYIVSTTTWDGSLDLTSGPYRLDTNFHVFHQRVITWPGKTSYLWLSIKTPRVDNNKAIAEAIEQTALYFYAQWAKQGLVIDKPIATATPTRD